MAITIKQPETEDEIRGMGYVQWKSWQEAFVGLAEPEWLEAATLELCVERAFRSQRNFRAPDSILVAKDGAQVVGFSTQGAYRDDTLPDAAEIYSLYILAEHYGTGVAQALMQAALQQLSPFRQAALWVLKDNGRAIRFYEKCGFRPDGAEQTANMGAERTELRMVRPLP